MSDTEIKDVAKAVTPEPSSTKDKTPAPAAEGAGEEVPLPTFKQNEIELGFILFRCVKDNEVGPHFTEPSSQIMTSISMIHPT